MFQPSLLALYFLGAFYGLLTVGIVRRACRPSCRTCMLWQKCLEQQLGMPGMKGKLCA